MSRIEAVKVALDPTPRQRDLLASNAGGARFAYNTMLAHVKEQLQYNESVTANDKVEVDWTQYALRRWWNAIRMLWLRGGVKTVRKRTVTPPSV